MSRRVVVVGAGVVGAAVADALAARPGVSVTLVDRAAGRELPGSTGHAPGFLGLLGETPVTTDLARASAGTYERLAVDGVPGFDRVGGLELATSEAGMAALEGRAGLAQAMGLPVEVVGPARAAALAPALVDPATCVGALHFPQDGLARAVVATRALLARAAERGAEVAGAEVTGLDTAGGRVTGVRTDGGSVPADDVVVATGVWAALLTDAAGYALPVVPVAHPYVHGPARAALPRMPFVRWPEHHVYARDHGDRWGLGSYDHVPLPVAPEDLGPTAERPWDAGVLGPAVDTAIGLLPPATRFAPERPLNGVFAMTPDNVPVVGAVPGTEGLWVAAGLWVTHAAGAAELLARVMAGEEVGGAEQLSPGRFAGQDGDGLRALALGRYRDIYARA